MYNKGIRLQFPRFSSRFYICSPTMAPTRSETVPARSPEDLLGINFDQEYQQYRCKGPTRKITPCPERIPAKHTSIQRLPQKIARTDMAKTNDNDIERLAEACLCDRNHHHIQKDLVTQGWIRLLKAVALIRNYAVKAAKQNIAATILNEERQEKEEPEGIDWVGRE